MIKMKDLKFEKKEKLTYFLLPFLIQFGVLGVCIPLHRIFIHIGPFLGETELIGMEMTNPTAGRLIFGILAFIAFIILTLFASQKAKKGSELFSFVLGMFAGVFLWQSIGEDLCNFSVNGIHFVSLESITVLPLVILFLLAMAYFWKTESLNWGVCCSMLSFSVNWLGHYVLVGVYPLASGLCDINLWCRCVGITLGPVLFVISLILGLGKGKKSKERMRAAILAYYSIVVLVFGMAGV